jgi:hypothetical protein
MSGSGFNTKWEGVTALAGINPGLGIPSVISGLAGDNEDLKNPSVPGSLPDYSQDEALKSQLQAALMSQYGVSGPAGGISWSGNFEDGTRKMDVTLSPFEQARLDSASAMLPDLNSSYGESAGQRAEDAVYNQFNDRYGEQFEDEVNSLHNTLLNRGIPVGSDAYNKAMRQLSQTQDDAYLNAANEGILAGSNAKTSELNNALNMFGSLSKYNNPVSDYVPGIGTNNFSSAYDNATEYQLQQNQQALDKYEIENNIVNNKWNALGNMGGGFLAGGGSVLGAIFSDERIKENIEQVGMLDNGLPVYKFNFAGEPETRIGLIAQEVARVIPEAVFEDENGLLAVDYDIATRPIEYGTNKEIITENKQ